MFLRLFEKTVRILLVTGIRLYQLILRPFFPPACRFYPSCSEYARLSLIKYGPLKGSWLAFKRLFKCHPFHPGGVDFP